MTKKTIVLLSIFGSVVLTLLGIAQTIRWFGLSTPKVELVQVEGEHLDITKLKTMDLTGIKNKAFHQPSLAGLNESWQYFFSYQVQRVYKQGTFPFVKIKSDTLSVMLDKHQ